MEPLRQMTLEKIRIVASDRIGFSAMAVLDDAQLHIHLDHAAKYIGVVLSTYIMGYPIGNQPIIVSFESPATWWQHLKSAIMPAFILRRFPVRMRTTTKCINFEKMVAFPFSKMKFPDSLGEPRMFIRVEGEDAQ